MSVTMGFKCVDFRQFYMPYGETEVKPTRKGIALRLTEWDQMKKVIELINNAYPTLAYPTLLPATSETITRISSGHWTAENAIPSCSKLISAASASRLH